MRKRPSAAQAESPAPRTYQTVMEFLFSCAQRQKSKSQDNESARKDNREARGGETVSKGVCSARFIRLRLQVFLQKM